MTYESEDKAASIAIQVEETAISLTASIRERDWKAVHREIESAKISIESIEKLLMEELTEREDEEDESS